MTDKFLSDEDRQNLEIGSGLQEGTIRSRGYWTAQTNEELAAIGFADFQLLAPALVVPIHTVDGSDSGLFQIRPLTPRLADNGKPIKYETTAKKQLRIDCPPSVRRFLGDPKEPLWITEGAKKADAAAQRGLVCIDILGVWNWRGKNDAGGVCELADWDRIAIKGRVIFLAFDNDVMIKPAVRMALIRLASMLKRRGAEAVHAIIFPEQGEGKAGFDDYFVAGGSVAELEDGDFIDDTILGGAIEVAGRSLPELTQKSLDAVLVESDPPSIFVRAGQLVRVVVDERATPVIDGLNASSLRGVMAAATEWKRAGKVCFPPKEVVENLLNLGRWPEVPNLVTIARAPVLTPSGRLTASQGYDAEAKVFIHTGGEIPPFQGDAKAAANWILEEVLPDFPFASDPDTAHALALMLLPIVRPFIAGPTPLHLFDAPVQGTGKSLAATVCLMPTQGDRVVVTPGTHDEEEWRKKIAAGLLSGAPYILFDNLTKKVDSDTLATCLTGVEWNDRLLSTMTLVRADIRCAWVATANNADLSRDILRRTAWIRLDAGMERPEDRQGYKHPYITKWASANRLGILSALLRMVTDWISIHKPNGSEEVQYRGRKLGTFEVWSSVMGSILENAGIDGFLGNIEELRAAANVEDGAFAEFYDRWYQTFGSITVKAKDLLETFRADDVLAGMVGDKGELSQSNRLGRILSNMVGRVHSGKKIVRTNSRANSSSFAMVLVPIQPSMFEAGQRIEITALTKGAPSENIAKTEFEDI